MKKRKNLASRQKRCRSAQSFTFPKKPLAAFLTGKTADPGLSTALDIADTVGLSPYEAFMDATLAAEFKVFLELKSKSEETEAERIRIIAENESLKAINDSLSDKIAILEMKLEHKEEMLRLHDRYNSYLDSLKKQL